MRVLRPYHRDHCFHVFEIARSATRRRDAEADFVDDQSVLLSVHDQSPTYHLRSYSHLRRRAAVQSRSAGGAPDPWMRFGGKRLDRGGWRQRVHRVGGARRAYRGPGRGHHRAGFRRLPQSLSADADHRELGKTSDRLAERVHLSRRNAVWRPGLRRRGRSGLSRPSHRQRDHQRIGLLHDPSRKRGCAFHRRRTARNAHDGGKGDDGPQCTRPPSGRSAIRL